MEERSLTIGPGRTDDHNTVSCEVGVVSCSNPFTPPDLRLTTYDLELATQGI